MTETGKDKIEERGGYKGYIDRYGNFCCSVCDQELVFDSAGDVYGDCPYGPEYCKECGQCFCDRSC